MIASGSLIAFKVAVAAMPVAGLAAAVVHAQKERRLRIEAESIAIGTERSVVVEVLEAGSDRPCGSVRFTLSPAMMSYLAAANSGSLPGMDTPDALMLALDIDAYWDLAGDSSFGQMAQPSQLLASRELFLVRSTPRSYRSVKVPLRALLDAHRHQPAGDPLHCSAEGLTSHRNSKRIHVSPFVPRKQFYWVRAAAKEANPGATPASGPPGDQRINA